MVEGKSRDDYAMVVDRKMDGIFDRERQSSDL
ncbi:uncharacterized protein G2W53_016186 [Senna tora]|uniref:Uncharacterized protein n=1 Tax=Senna tora TaxID=362788 RepID=A0A834WX07_9FABA|nr:uncharacterized protein G2W53_016186 [Senna tora]